MQNEHLREAATKNQERRTKNEEPAHPAYCFILTSAFGGAPIRQFENSSIRKLLDPKPLVHEALQAGLVKDVVSEFLVGKHGERGAFGVGHHLGSFLHR